jgi:hypothetical protein
MTDLESMSSSDYSGVPAGGAGMLSSGALDSDVSCLHWLTTSHCFEGQLPVVRTSLLMACRPFEVPMFFFYRLW